MIRRLAVIALAVLATAAIASAADGRARLWCDDGPQGIAIHKTPYHCLVEGIYLRHLHWRHWGAAKTHARGIEVRAGGRRRHVRVTAYRLRPPPCASRFELYRRLKVRSSHDTRVLHPRYFLCE